MSSQKIAIGVLFLFLLGGCGILDPFVDRRRNPGVQDVSQLYSGPSTTDKPVVCYNGWWSDDAELQELATAECVKHATGNYAEFVEKTYFDGRLLLPHHAHYQCVNKKD